MHTTNPDRNRRLKGRKPGLPRRTVTALLALVILAPALAGFAPQLADAQTAPNAYYGSVYSDSGHPAPEGTVIVAVVGSNDDVADSITVESTGEYGGSGGLDDKLRVESDIDRVTFHVGDADGPKASETDNPEPETERLALTFPAGTFPSTTAVATDTPTAVATDTPTPVVTRTLTATRTRTSTVTVTETEKSTTAATVGSTSTESDGELPNGAEGTEPAVATDASTATETVRSQFVVTNATLNETQLAQDESVLVTATIRNRASTNRTFRAGLSVAKTVLTTKTQSIPAGDSNTVQFTHQPTESGEYPVAVNGTSAGTLTVGEETTDNSLLPFGPLQSMALYVALLIALLYGILKALAIYYGY